jgi:hypothetical protein
LEHKGKVDPNDNEKATFSELLGQFNSGNQDKLYAQITNAQDDSFVQFVDQDTQDELHTVDNEFVKNAGGILIDGSNLV